MPCSYCGDTSRKIVKGLCWACYYRQNKTGSLEYKRTKAICTEDGCGKNAVSRGLCDMHRRRRDRHGHTKQTRPGDWGERTSHPRYKTWNSMIRRCHDPKHKDFVNYGARGIKVCERWHDFWAFIEDTGGPPTPKHSIDRIDNGGNYDPGNWRWATATEQARNKRTSVLTRELAAEIRRRASMGDAAGDIARSLRVSYDNVRHVILGNSWNGDPDSFG